MRNGMLITVDDRPALRFERVLNHPIERVWRAVTEPAELAQWFVGPVEWTLVEGAKFEAMGEQGEVTELEPPHLIAWEWGGERFRFELSAEGDGCRLVFLHVFDDRNLGAQHASGWEAHFDKLDAHLDGRSLSDEEAFANLRELNDVYAERFRLDPEIGRRAIAQYHPELERS